MIADLDETLRQLVTAELPIKNGEIEVEFDQPKREWSARLTGRRSIFPVRCAREPCPAPAPMEQVSHGPVGDFGGNGSLHTSSAPFRGLHLR
jgi:hypothetical protein